MIAADERAGLPSASGMQRIALCPGSWLAEAGMPTEEKGEGSDAGIGTLVHAELAGASVEALSEAEKEVADRCRAIESQLLEAFAPFVQRSVLREHRLWMVNESGNRIASGQADAVFLFSGARALIVDYKTGRLGAESATGNLQLRMLAVLLHEAMPHLANITVAIIQPLATPRVSECTYSLADLIAAREQIVELLAEANREGAKRNAGEAQCKHCRARATCPEIERVTLALASQAETGIVDRAQLPMLLEACATADKHIEAIRRLARVMLEADPDSIEGWRLKDGARVSSITDPQGVYEKCRALGMSPEDFLSAVTVNKGRLADAVKKTTGLKGGPLEAMIESTTEGFTAEKQNAPSLAREKRIA